MRINELHREGVLGYLLTSDRGLSGEEARRRLDEFGQNEIKAARRKPLAIRFVAQLTHFLAVLLWIGAGLAFALEATRPGEGMLTLGLAIVCVIFINAIFTFLQEYRAERSIGAPPFVTSARRKSTRIAPNS